MKSILFFVISKKVYAIYSFYFEEFFKRSRNAGALCFHFYNNINYYDLYMIIIIKRILLKISY
jgi:hypothetical protein